jgi:hypothetical protein
MSSYNPVPATVYGRTENRFKALKVLHVPLKAGNTVDSIDEAPQLFIVGTALRYYVDGVFYEITGSTITGRFGIEDTLGAQNRSIDMEQFMFGTTNASLLSYQTRKPGATPEEDVYLGWYSDTNYSGLYASSGTAPDDSLMGIRIYPDKATVNVRGTASPYPNGEFYLPVSVTFDGSSPIYADANGNLTISSGSGSGWQLNGNAGTNPATDFIGTTDFKDLRFKVVGQQSGIISAQNSMTAFGYQSLSGLVGYGNTAFGERTLNAYSNSSGYNVAIGHRAGEALTSGGTNVIIGAETMLIATTAAGNVAIGRNAAPVLTTALNNVIIGQSAALGLTSGGFNTIIGNNVAPSISTGNSNVAIGTFAGQGGSGTFNVWVGANNSTSGNSGSNNTALGFNANFNGAVNNSIALGAGATPSVSFQFMLPTNITSFNFPNTVTAAGTVGAQTISKPFGTVNFAAGATTLVVTNTTVTTTSKIFVQVYGTDTTALYARVTRANGSFTITLNAAATAETAVAFFIAV